MIKFYVLKGLKAKEIYEHLLEVYKESSLQPGRTKLEDAKHIQKPQPHQKSLSKFIILLVKIQVWLSVKLLIP